MALLLTHAAQVVTLAGPARARRGAEMAELGLVVDGGVLIAAGAIVAVGPSDEVARAAEGLREEVETLDCHGMVLSPGLVDCHTHLVFAAPRLNDYERRIAGLDYSAIAAAGGGIQSSVHAFRQAEEGGLVAGAARWLERARRHGATTVEVKSGYGLTLEAEGKALRVAAAAGAAGGDEVVRTFLGAHIVPPGENREAYMDALCHDMLPAVARERSAEFADIFCDPAGFSLAETRRYLGAAQALGFGLKLHAEQFAHTGGLALGVSMGAVSVDHLEAATRDDARLLAQAATVATLIPGADFFLGQPYPPARMLIDSGAAVALATDFNPGTCPIISLPLIMSLGCSALRMSPAEAWTAVTINAAAALGRAGRCGSLETGKRADVALFEADDHRAIPYYAGTNLCRGVVQGGVWRPNPNLDRSDNFLCP